MITTSASAPLLFRTFAGFRTRWFGLAPALAGLLAFVSNDAAAAPFGTEFSYQGRMNDAAGNANGRYDFKFALHDALAGGTAITAVTNPNVLVAGGLFTTSIDFGANVFNGSAYWLEIGVRTNGTGAAFATLSPRQAVAPTPNALYAALAGSVPGGSITSSKLGDNSVGTVALQNNAVTGAKIANGQVVRSVNGLQDAVVLAAGANTTLATNGNTLTIAASGDWKLGGNAGTTGANFVGTTDNQSLALKVNGATALRIEPTISAPNIVGGLASIRPTVIGANVRGAVIAGGNAPAGPVTGFGGGDFHAAFDSDGTVGGGFGNKVGTDNGDADDSPFATVAGGVFNSAASYAATVAGGDGNVARGLRSAVGGGAANVASGESAVIGGGVSNSAQDRSASIGGGQNNIASSAHAAVAGGGWNTASGASAFVGGGGGNTFGGPWPNTASGNWSAILGGWNNTASGYSSVVGGGGGNTASGYYALIPGGDRNLASGQFTFAAGRNARAAHSGSFVWGDSDGQPLTSSRNDQFLLRAAGGLTLDGAATLGYEEPGSGSGRRVLALARDAADDVNAGKIAYRPSWGIDALGIVGAGAGSGDRMVRIWDHLTVAADLRMSGGRTLSSTGRLHIQANEDLYLNPFAGAGTVVVGGGGGPGNLAVQGSTSTTGLGFPNNFGPDNNFVGNAGNYIAFGHAGVSEDFIGYRDNTFFFKDSPGGGDTCDPVVEMAVLRITGGCDLAEPFQMSHQDIPQGAVVIIDEENPGKLKMSRGAYDQRVAGIVSGANGVKAGITLHQEGLIDGGQNVALTGRVYVQADATACAIKPGDLLTTSDTPGHAMKVTDHARAQGAILGKAMTALKEGRGLVLVLVSLQ